MCPGSGTIRDNLGLSSGPALGDAPPAYHRPNGSGGGVGRRYGGAAAVDALAAAVAQGQGRRSPASCHRGGPFELRRRRRAAGAGSSPWPRQRRLRHPLPAGRAGGGCKPGAIRRVPISSRSWPRRSGARWPQTRASSDRWRTSPRRLKRCAVSTGEFRELSDAEAASAWPHTTARGADAGPDRPGGHGPPFGGRGGTTRPTQMTTATRLVRDQHRGSAPEAEAGRSSGPPPAALHVRVRAAPFSLAERGTGHRARRSRRRRPARPRTRPSGRSGDRPGAEAAGDRGPTRGVGSRHDWPGQVETIVAADEDDEVRTALRRVVEAAEAGHRAGADRHRLRARCRVRPAPGRAPHRGWAAMERRRRVRGGGAGARADPARAARARRRGARAS